MEDHGVKIGYFDTSAGPTPYEVGQIQGTPTIKFVKPKPKQKKNSVKKKRITDYNGERKFDALKEYVEYMLPSFVMRVTGETGKSGLDQFLAKADKYALPKVLISKTS